MFVRSIFKSVVVVMGGCLLGVMVSLLLLAFLFRGDVHDNPGEGFGIVLIVGIGAITGATVATILSLRAERKKLNP